MSLCLQLFYFSLAVFFFLNFLFFLLIQYVCYFFQKKKTNKCVDHGFVGRFFITGLLYQGTPHRFYKTSLLSLSYIVGPGKLLFPFNSEKQAFLSSTIKERFQQCLFEKYAPLLCLAELLVELVESSVKISNSVDELSYMLSVSMHSILSFSIICLSVCKLSEISITNCSTSCCYDFKKRLDCFTGGFNFFLALTQNLQLANIYQNVCYDFPVVVGHNQTCL